MPDFDPESDAYVLLDITEAEFAALGGEPDPVDVAPSHRRLGLNPYRFATCQEGRSGPGRKSQQPRGVSFSGWSCISDRSWGSRATATATARPFTTSSALTSCHRRCLHCSAAMDDPAQPAASISPRQGHGRPSHRATTAIVSMLSALSGSHLQRGCRGSEKEPHARYDEAQRPGSSQMFVGPGAQVCTTSRYRPWGGDSKSPNGWASGRKRCD